MSVGRRGPTHLKVRDEVRTGAQGRSGERDVEEVAVANAAALAVSLLHRQWSTYHSSVTLSSCQRLSTTS